MTTSLAGKIVLQLSVYCRGIQPTTISSNDSCDRHTLDFSSQCWLHYINYNYNSITIRIVKHSIKFRQIGHTTSQSFFPKTISAWNMLAFAEAPSLGVFRSNFL